MGLSSGYHSPALTYERAVQSRKSLCEPLRSTEETEKGSLQTMESPTVCAETGEVHVPGSTVGSHCKGCTNAAFFSRVSPVGLASNDLLELLFTPTHLSHSTAHTTPMFSFYHSAIDVHLILARVKSCQGCAEAQQKLSCAAMSLPCCHYEHSLLL